MLISTFSNTLSFMKSSIYFYQLFFLPYIIHSNKIYSYKLFLNYILTFLFNSKIRFYFKPQWPETSLPQYIPVYRNNTILLISSDNFKHMGEAFGGHLEEYIWVLSHKIAPDYQGSEQQSARNVRADGLSPEFSDEQSVLRWTISMITNICYPNIFTSKHAQPPTADRLF